MPFNRIYGIGVLFPQNKGLRTTIYLEKAMISKYTGQEMPVMVRIEKILQCAQANYGNAPIWKSLIVNPLHMILKH